MKFQPHRVSNPVYRRVSAVVCIGPDPIHCGPLCERHVARGGDRVQCLALSVHTWADGVFPDLKNKFINVWVFFFCGLELRPRRCTRDSYRSFVTPCVSLAPPRSVKFSRHRSCCRLGQIHYCNNLVFLHACVLSFFEFHFQASKACSVMP